MFESVRCGLRCCLLGLGCALLLVGATLRPCAGQAPALSSSAFSALSYTPSAQSAGSLSSSYVSPAIVAQRTLRTPWLMLAASTTAAFAASFAVTEAYALRYGARSDAASLRSRDLGLDADTRLKAREQSASAQQRADLLQKVSDICLAGTVATAGATLLIWLTSKRRRHDDQPKMLIGPMVLRGYNGGGLVLREKF